MIDNVRIGGAPVNGDATTFRQKSIAALLPIRPQWKLRWLGRLIRLKNADEFSPAAVDIAWALAECFYEKSLAEVSCSFLARKTGLSKRWVVHGIGELERVPNTVIVRARGQWQGRVKSKYAMVLTPEDLGPDAAKLGVTGPVASDTWVNEPSPTRVNEGSPTRVNEHSPNYTNSPKQREGEVVSADAGLAPFGGSPAQRSKAASDGAASRRSKPRTRARKAGPPPGKLLIPRWRATCRPRPSLMARGGTRRRKNTSTRTGSSFRRRGCAMNAGARTRSRRAGRSRSWTGGRAARPRRWQSRSSTMMLALPRTLNLSGLVVTER
jgi:hypothetical protein